MDERTRNKYILCGFVSSCTQCLFFLSKRKKNFKHLIASWVNEGANMPWGKTSSYHILWVKKSWTMPWLVSFRGLIQNFQQASPPFHMRRPPPSQDKYTRVFSWQCLSAMLTRNQNTKLKEFVFHEHARECYFIGGSFPGDKIEILRPDHGTFKIFLHPSPCLAWCLLENFAKEPTKFWTPLMQTLEVPTPKTRLPNGLAPYDVTVHL